MSEHVMKPFPALAIFALLLATPALAVPPSPEWSIRRFGLFDAEHTGSGAEQRSTLFAMNASVRLAGTSDRYRPTGTYNGRSAWTATRDSTTLRIGFIDAEHTGLSNTQYSDIIGINATQSVIGTSARFAGVVGTGASAWVWTPDLGTTRLGFIDGPYLNSDGLRVSTPVDVNNDGVVIGTSTRFDATGDSGAAAWRWTAGTGLTRLGFTSADYVRADGLQNSQVTAINSAGVITGSSQPFGGAAGFGRDAWVWSQPNGYQSVGLFDAEHNGTGNVHLHSAYTVNEAGRVIGSSARFRAGTSTLDGASAWTWSPATGMSRMGLLDAEHTSSTTATRESNAFQLSEEGYVLGTSTRYVGNNARGYSAWIWSQADETQRLGFVDAEHTGSSGIRRSFANRVNASGQVLGTSDRFTATGLAGASAWVWTKSDGLTRVGLLDANHTNGVTQSSTGIDLNEAGEAIGWSDRYPGGTPGSPGRSGWYYSPVTGDTQALVFSVRSDGYAFTDPEFLTESGWVLGSYQQFSGMTLLATSAFLWSSSDGMVELGSLVDGGLTSAGWSTLTSVVSFNELTAIAGHGRTPGAGTASQAVYLMTIPTPSVTGTLIFVLLGLHPRRRVTNPGQLPSFPRSSA